jgi:hypothetical protein
MDTPCETGVRARPGRDGLTLERINIGSYGEVPDRWPYDNDTPRGSIPRNENYVAGSYTLYDKAEVWADNAGRLYEEGIQRRWVPASDINWLACKSDDPRLEAAMRQLSTSLSETSFVLCQAVSAWFEQISYGFHEVKAFLANQGFDLMRHAECFRKRALWSGKLGLETPGTFNRTVVGQMKYTGMVAQVHVLAESFLLSLYAHGDRLAPTAEDARIFRRCLQDVARHVAYGTEQLRYLLQERPGELTKTTILFDLGESMLAKDLADDTPYTEALVTLLGKGDDDEGRRRLASLRRHQVESYQRRLVWIGIDKTTRLHPLFAGWVAQPTTRRPR